MRNVASAVVMSIAALTSGAPPTPDAYIDALDSFTDPAEAQRWTRMTRALADEFADRCGDTFCEGEYSNIEPISLRCSVAAGSGELKRCVWVFGESNEDIDGQTGEIHADHKTVVCDIPVTGTAAALGDALLSPDNESALDRKLPGTNASVYDALVKCL